MAIHFNHAALGVSMRAMRSAGKHRGCGDDKDPDKDTSIVVAGILTFALIAAAIIVLLYLSL